MRQPERGVQLEVAQAMARGSLMGAGGNSGVILSQIWRGIAAALDGKEKITGTELAQGPAAGIKGNLSGSEKTRRKDHSHDLTPENRSR